MMLFEHIARKEITHLRNRYSQRTGHTKLSIGVLRLQIRLAMTRTESDPQKTPDPRPISLNLILI